MNLLIVIIATLFARFAAQGPTIALDVAAEKPDGKVYMSMCVATDRQTGQERKALITQCAIHVCSLMLTTMSRGDPRPLMLVSGLTSEEVGILSRAGAEVIESPGLRPWNATGDVWRRRPKTMSSDAEPKRLYTFHKLHAWDPEVTKARRVAWIDSDAVVIRNATSLLQVPQVPAAWPMDDACRPKGIPDDLWEQPIYVDGERVPKRDIYWNSGVVVFEPSQRDHDELWRHYDLGAYTNTDPGSFVTEQDLLQSFYWHTLHRRPHALPATMNFRGYDCSFRQAGKDPIRIVHKSGRTRTIIAHACGDAAEKKETKRDPTYVPQFLRIVKDAIAQDQCDADQARRQLRLACPTQIAPDAADDHPSGMSVTRLNHQIVYRSPGPSGLSSITVTGELIHPETYRETRLAIQNCKVVAYSSVAVRGAVPLVQPPRSSGRCALLYVSEASGPNPNAEMTTIVHRRTNATRQFSNRKFSKIPKLVPHLLFGGRVSVFFDTKLRMKADLTALSNLARDTFLTAYKHPTCLTGCAPMTWMQTEAKLLMNSGRIGQRDQLVAQVKRYSEIMASHTRCQTYIDGALLIQRNAHALFDAWSAEFFKPENSDRDQIPFAYIAATTCPNIVELSPKRPCTNNLCHWYENEGVAKLVRHKFEADDAAASAKGAPPVPNLG